jgi:predicted ATPase
MSDHFFIITGGPGSGKSTLIDALEKRGYARTLEAGRAIIQDQLSIGGRALPWIDPAFFAELMLSWELRSYRTAEDETGPVFFDRGIPDVVGYLQLMNLPVPLHMTNAVETFRYNRRVFLAPPWPEIFAQDRERKQTWEEAVRTCEAMRHVYTNSGYELVELPCCPVGERVAFILDRLNT